VTQVKVVTSHIGYRGGVRYVLALTLLAACAAPPAPAAAPTPDVVVDEPAPAAAPPAPVDSPQDDGETEPGGATTTPGVTGEGEESLPPEVIRRVVRSHYDKVRACYTAGLGRDPNLRGRVVVKFAIATNGSVSSVSNGGGDLPDPTAIGCVLQVFRGMTFPAPKKLVTVSYPLVFEPSK
jgi:hypothetical protein